MKAHLYHYSMAYLAALAALVCFVIAVFVPMARVAFWVLTLWFVLSAIVNAVFLRAMK